MTKRQASASCVPKQVVFDGSSNNNNKSDGGGTKSGSTTWACQAGSESAKFGTQ